MSDRRLRAWPEGRPHQLALSEASVYDNLRGSAMRCPDRPAIVYYDTVISYRELHAEVERLAGFLTRNLGAGKGDRVLLYMQNSPQYIIAYYAILRADCVVVPVNPMSKAKEICFVVNDTGTRVGFCAQDTLADIDVLLGTTPLQHIVVAAYSDYIRVTTDLDLHHSVSAPRRALGGPGILVWADVLGAAPAPAAHRSRADDDCVIPYSSGTTGQPRGCLHTHRSVNFVVAVYVEWLRLAQGTVVLTSLPLFHVTGMQNSMNVPIYTGSTLVVMTRWDRRVAAKLIARYRVAHWRSITTMAIDFLSDPDLDSTDLSSLIGLGGGGAPMPKVLAAKLEQRTGLQYIEGYGLTETISATHINPPQAPKPQCLGVALFNVDARIIDPRSLLELDANQAGEIVINSPQLFQGYWNNPQATAAAFVRLDGKAFLRSGDLGYCDEEGYFFMVDRLKRMINASGYKIWPAEVEALMLDHPDIHEVCIIAASDPRRGETVKAIIVARRDTSAPCAEDIRAWCRDHMAAYKVPEIIEFAKALPRSGSGKILWRELLEREKHGRDNLPQSDAARLNK